MTSNIFSNIFSKKIITFLFSGFITLLLCLAVVAEPLDNNPKGHLTENKKADKSMPVIQEINIYEGGTKISPHSLTPQKDYDIKVIVQDNDGIGNPKGGLDEVNVKLWYDEEGDDLMTGTPDKNIFRADNKLNSQNSIKIKWVRGGAASLSGGGTTWELNSKKSNIPGKSDFNSTAFEFVFNVKIGKTAKEASMTNKWQIAVKTVDVDGHESYSAYKSVYGYGLPMDFYGEIMMNNIKLDLCDSSKESSFGDLIYEVKGLTYVANAGYDTTVKGDNIWEDSKNSENFLLRYYDAEQDNTFSIKSNKINDIKTARLLPLNQENLEIEKNVSASISDQPESESNFLFISLNKKVNKNNNYTGAITYSIVNSKH